MFAIALKCLTNSYFGKYRKYLSFSFWILAEYVELWKISIGMSNEKFVIKRKQNKYEM